MIKNKKDDSLTKNNLSQDQKIVARHIQFSGPLPPPEILKSYDNIIKNGAERIFDMTEKQMQHRIELEKIIVKEELKQGYLGQKIGFFVSVISLTFSLVLGLMNHDILAGIIGGSTVVGLAMVFVLGKKDSQDKDFNSDQ